MIIRSSSLLLRCALVACAAAACTPRNPAVRFTVTVPATAHSGPLTGRVFIVLSRDSAPEPRLAMGARTMTTPFFGVDVAGLAPGQPAVIDDTTRGYLTLTLRDIPPGDYYVQALANVYTEFHCADGHTIWAHMDQWEGQHLTRSPGNLVSPVQRVHLDPAKGFDINLQTTTVIPPIVVPADTKWVKRIKIQSDILTKFWGHPMFIGATVLLPQGYDEHPAVHYPVLYEQGHFQLTAPMGFTTDSTPAPTAVQLARQASYNTEPGYEFYKEWTAPKFPRMFVITFQHPTPYFDDSYAVNSANNGPYGDAIMQELIPYLESHFRIIAKPYARVLSGGSTGGWESLALQLYHPDFFGGTWTLYPDPISFRHYVESDAYADTNAFIMGTPPLFTTISEWLHPERYFARAIDGQAVQSMRQLSQLEDVEASHGRAAEQLEDLGGGVRACRCRRISGAALGQGNRPHRSHRRRLYEDARIRLDRIREAELVDAGPKARRQDPHRLWRHGQLLPQSRRDGHAGRVRLVEVTTRRGRIPLWPAAQRPWLATHLECRAATRNGGRDHRPRSRGRQFERLEVLSRY